MTEITPEIGRYLQQFRKQLKFKPRPAVLACLETDDESWLIGGWELCRLVAWSFFDQQTRTEVDGDEPNKDDTGRIKRKPTTRPFKPSYAYKAGQLYLLYHLPRLRRKKGTPSFRKPSIDDMILAFSMFLETGEKRRSFGLGGRTLSALHKDTHTRQELRVVYHVMDFLVRAVLACRDDLCTVAPARHFAQEVEHVSASTVEKIWNRYRTAAPYIYAFYPRLYPTGSGQGAHREPAIETDADWIYRITQVAEKSTVEECLGHAAFAADVLEGTGTRDVRIEDFEDVLRVTPSVRPFDVDDESIIKKYYEDKTSPLK